MEQQDQFWRRLLPSVFQMESFPESIRFALPAAIGTDYTGLGMARTFIVSLLITLPVAVAAAEPTFYRDVLPVLQKNCQGCHRPGEPAPMSLLSYKDTRPWAKAIREAVRLKKMPPWFADPHVGKFANERGLTATEIETLARWADSGAPEGDVKDAPALLTFTDGWNIGKPDMVVEMPFEYEVPASGTIEYTYFVIPTNFTEDRWVQLAEVRPGHVPAGLQAVSGLSIAPRPDRHVSPRPQSAAGLEGERGRRTGHRRAGGHRGKAGPLRQVS